MARYMERYEGSIAGLIGAGAMACVSTVVQPGRAKAPADAAARVRNCRLDGLFSRDVCVNASLAIGSGFIASAGSDCWGELRLFPVDSENFGDHSRDAERLVRRVRLRDPLRRWDDDGNEYA